jgi:hypothetical protein
MTFNTKKMKLLVTGASGFIGHEVSRQLSLGGYRPRLMIRQAGDDCDICHFDADFVIADLRKPNSLKQAVKGVDGIIHLGARATFESYAILKPSILEGSLALMQAGIEAGVKRFVYSSSLLVYSGSPFPVNAATPVNPVLDYGRIKVDTEKQLSKMAASAGIAFAALRLPHVYGLRDLYFRQLAGRPSDPAGPGQKHLHPPACHRCGTGHHRLCRTGLYRHPALRRPPAVHLERFPEPCQTALPEGPCPPDAPMAGPAGHGPADPLPKHQAQSGLETPGAVRTYNFNLAVEPDLLWQDLGLAPRYPTIYDGIPAAVAAGMESGVSINAAR